MPFATTYTKTNKSSPGSITRTSPSAKMATPTSNATGFLDTCISLISRVDTAANHHWAVFKRQQHQQRHLHEECDDHSDCDSVPSVETDDLHDGEALRFQFQMQWRQLREDVCTMLRQHFTGRQQLASIEAALKKCAQGEMSTHTEEELLVARGKVKVLLDRTHPTRVLALLTKLGLFSHYKTAGSQKSPSFLDIDLSLRFRETEQVEPITATA